MLGKDRISRRSFLRIAALVGASVAGVPVLAACQPKVVKETVLVEGEGKVIKETVIVEGEAKVVEKEVTRVVEKQVPAPKEVVTISVMSPPYNKNMVDKAIEIFEAEQEGRIKVKHDETLYHEISKKTEMGFVAGTVQDINYGHNRWYHYGCYKGLYRSVDDLLETMPPRSPEDFWPMVIEQNKFEGKQYCLPDVFHPGRVIAMYNKQILGEATGSEDPPENWSMEDLFELAIKCTNKETGMFGLEHVAYAIHCHVAWTRAWGSPSDETAGWLVSKDGRKFQFLDPLVQEASKMIYDLANEYGACPKTADKIEGGLFNAGRCAMVCADPGSPTGARAKVGDRFEVGAVLMPVGPQGRFGTSHCGNQWMISMKSKHPVETWKFLLRLTETDMQVARILENGIHGGRRSAWLDYQVAQVAPDLPLCVPMVDAGLIEPFPMPNNLRFTEVNDVYRNLSDLMWNGEESFEFSATVQEKVQAAMDEPRPPKAA